MLLLKVLLLLTLAKLFWKAVPPMFCLTPYVARLPMLLIALL